MFRILVVSSLVFASSCASLASAATATASSLAACDVVQCISKFDLLAPGYDLFPVKSTVTSASEHWSVQYYPSFKILNNTLANEQYVLYQCGSTLPTAASSPSIRSDAKYFKVPIQRACVDETTPVNFIELLGVRTTIKAQDVTYVTSACLNVMNQTGVLSSFESPYGGNPTIRAQQIASQCDIVFGSNAADPTNKTISYGITLESTMLGRAEWIKYLAFFYNKEAAANDVFAGIQQRYQALSAAAISASTSTNNKPVVAWIQWSDPKYATTPFKIFTAVEAAYKMNLVTDAGGIPFQPTTFTFANASQFQQALMNGNVDIVIDETFALPDYNAFLNKFEFSTSQVSSFKFLANNNVWRDDRMVHNVGGDWFESALSNADAVLNDMVSIVQPSVSVKPRTWFRNVAKNETQFVILDTCESISAPALPINAPPANSSITCPTYLLNPAPYKSSGIVVSPLLMLTAISGFAAAIVANLF